MSTYKKIVEIDAHLDEGVAITSLTPLEVINGPATQLDVDIISAPTLDVDVQNASIPVTSASTLAVNHAATLTVSHPATINCDLIEIAGSGISAGTGVVGATGTQRITIGTDDPLITDIKDRLLGLHQATGAGGDTDRVNVNLATMTATFNAVLQDVGPSSVGVLRVMPADEGLPDGFGVMMRKRPVRYDVERVVMTGRDTALTTAQSSIWGHTSQLQQTFLSSGDVDIRLVSTVADTASEFEIKWGNSAGDTFVSTLTVNGTTDVVVGSGSIVYALEQTGNGASAVHSGDVSVYNRTAGAATAGVPPANSVFVISGGAGSIRGNAHTSQWQVEPGQNLYYKNVTICSDGAGFFRLQEHKHDWTGSAGILTRLEFPFASGVTVVDLSSFVSTDCAIIIKGSADSGTIDMAYIINAYQDGGFSA